MNEEHLDDLIDRHLNGVLDGRDRQELEDRLLHSAADRARFWQLAETHVLVHEAIQRGLAGSANHAAITATTVIASAERAATPPARGTPWRPLTAAAAGLAIGVFCATAAWAYVSPGFPKFVKHVLAVANAGFEEAVAPLPNGVPVQYGVWSGDHAAVVGREQGIVPKQGQRMFRFLRSDSTEASSRGTIFNGNIYQVIDIRPLRDAIANGAAIVDWSAWVNCVREHVTEQTKFVASVWAFAGDTAILPRNWADKLYTEIAYSSWKIAADEDSQSWQRIAGSMMVPPDADFLVVELKVVPASPIPVDGAVTFAGHYADDVQLILRTHSRPATAASLPP